MADRHLSAAAAKTGHRRLKSLKAAHKELTEALHTLKVPPRTATLKDDVDVAKGNAEATVLNAKAEAESIRIRANALEANAKLVEWEAVQKWDGKLPVYSMGGAVPFINLSGK